MQLPRYTSSRFTYNLFLLKLFGYFVQYPARHVHRLAVVNGDDDVAVKWPAVLAIIFAGARGMVRVAVIKTQDQFAFGAGGFFGFDVFLGIEAEAVVLLVFFEGVG